MAPIDVFQYNPDKTIKQQKTFKKGEEGTIQLAKNKTLYCRGEENGGIFSFKEKNESGTLKNKSEIIIKDLATKIVARESTVQKK